MAGENASSSVSRPGTPAYPVGQVERGITSAHNDYALYLDTSALLKLYVEEDGTGTVERAVAEAWEVHTSEIAYLEARVSLARLWHSGVIESDDELRETVGYLDDDWEDYLTQPYSYTLAERAAGLATKYEGLRSYDALHLATVLEIASRQGERETRMLAYDRKLVKVSRHEVILYHNPYAHEASGKEAAGE